MWLGALSRFVLPWSLDVNVIFDCQDELKELHGKFEGVLTKAITAPEPFPSPGRPIRNIATRCLNTIFTRGETRNLFDTIRSLLNVVGDLKAYDADIKKVCVSSRI